MSKVAVVYWSGTGNTEAMAKAVCEGVREKGGKESLIEAASFKAEDMDSYDAIVFGCPAMGAENLEPAGGDNFHRVVCTEVTIALNINHRKLGMNILYIASLVFAVAEMNYKVCVEVVFHNGFQRVKVLMGIRYNDNFHYLFLSG